MKRLGVWLLLATAVALTVLCGLAWKAGTFHRSGWAPSGTGLVIRFLIGWTVATCLLLFAPRRFARGIVVAGFGLTAITSTGIGPVAAVVTLIASATALGGMVVRPGGFARSPQEGAPTSNTSADPPDGLLELTVSFLTGAALLAGVASITLHFPVNSRLTWAAVLFLPCFLNRRALAHWWLMVVGWIFSPHRSRPIVFGLASLATAILFGQLIVALLPEVGFDALAYHLVVPHQVEIHGSWAFDFQNFAWAVMPIGAESLWTPIYLLGGEQSTRLMSYVSLLAMLGCLFALLRACATHSWAWLAVTLFASAPLTALEMASLFVENTLASYLFAAFALLATYQHRLSARGSVAVAILLGGALATKLLAVFAIAPLGLWLAWRLVRRHGWRRGIAFASGCLLVIATVGGIAYGYAWTATGNPLFPFFNETFDSEHWKFGNVVNKNYQGNMSWDLPWQAVIHTNRFLQAAKGGFGFQYLVLLPFLVAGVWPGSGRPRGTVLAFVVFTVSFAGIFRFQQYLRYIYPMLGLLSFVCIAGAARITRGSLAKRVGVLVALLAIAGNVALFPAGSPWLRSAPFEAAFSPAARQALIRHRMPTRALIDYVNLTHQHHGRVAFLAPAVSGDLDGTALYYSWHNPTFQRASLHAKTVDEVAAAATKFRVTHFVAGPRRYGNSELVERFLGEYARPVLEINGTTLYETHHEVAHGAERLENGDFSDGSASWKTIGSPGPTFDATAGVVRLARRQHIAQRSTLGELGSCHLEIQARSMGDPTPGLVSIKWFDEAGKLIQRTNHSPFFGRLVQTSTYRSEPPDTAMFATVRMTPVGKDKIEVHSVSFRH